MSHFMGSKRCLHCNQISMYSNNPCSTKTRQEKTIVYIQAIIQTDIDAWSSSFHSFWYVFHVKLFTWEPEREKMEIKYNRKNDEKMSEFLNRKFRWFKFFFQLLQIFLKFAVLLSWKMGFFLHFQGKYCRYHFERFQALGLLQNTCQMEKLVVDMVTHKFDEKFKTRRDFFLWKNSRTDQVFFLLIWRVFVVMKNDDDVSNQLSYLQYIVVMH